MLGYRALCHEVYEKKAALRVYPLLRANIDRGRTLIVQQEVQQSYNVMEAGTRKGLNHFKKLKRKMDDVLLNGDFSALSSCIIRTTGGISVVATGVISPNRDVDGRELQVLHDPIGKQESLMCSVVPYDGDTAFVLTWPSSQIAPRRFLESVLKVENRFVPSILIQFLFMYIGNTFFSAKWWESLNEEQRGWIQRAARVSNAYYTNFEFVRDSLGKASLSSVEWNV